MALWRSKRALRAPADGTGASSPAAGAVFDRADLGSWYAPVMVGPTTLGARATSPDCLRQAMGILRQLQPDDYLRYLLAYYETGLRRFGDSWCYADIVTALLAAAQLLQPQSYLEIGVRRGRSMAMVARTCPTAAIVGCDLWAQDYAGMENPGPAFVRAEMHRVGHTGSLDLLSGDSHALLPRYFREHPETAFDLITVDGDHSRRGARQDLRDVLPRLKVGGVLVFDDIAHPDLPHLADVWRTVVCADRRFVTWEFSELGYGVAVAVRRD